MTFHTYVCHQICSWNYCLIETKTKANGQMDNYMTRGHYDFLFFALCLSGIMTEALLQFKSVVFKVFSNLINSIIHFT